MTLSKEKELVGLLEEIEATEHHINELKKEKGWLVKRKERLEQELGMWVWTADLHVELLPNYRDTYLGNWERIGEYDSDEDAKKAVEAEVEKFWPNVNKHWLNPYQYVLSSNYDIVGFRQGYKNSNKS